MMVELWVGVTPSGRSPVIWIPNEIQTPNTKTLYSKRKKHWFNIFLLLKMKLLRKWCCMYFVVFY